MKTKVLILIACVLSFASCGKKDDTGTKPPEPSVTFVNTNAGSTWTYHEDNASGGTVVGSDYTITSTSGDSTIGGRKYHVYSYSYGGSQYLNLSGHEYYQYDSIPLAGGIALERLYLKDDAAAGASWSQDVNVTVPGILIPIPLKVTNTIAEKGITRTVKGVEYKDVIHVSTKISSGLIPSGSGLTSNIDSYFAPKYGLIENTTKVDVNYMGFVEKVDLSTQLVNADLK